MSLDRHTFPPSGWIFRQPQTGWTNPTPLGSTFDQTVQLIIKHRKANGAITAKFSLATNPQAVATELERFTCKRLGIPEVVQAPFSASPSSLPGGLAAAVGDRHSAVWGIKRAAQGTAVVLDWLGAGGNPVAQELAEKRAAICVACPMNAAPDWYTSAPAELIRQAVKAWQVLKGTPFAFQTSQGDKLKSCAACKCLLTLKTFVDIRHILAHTKPDVLNDLNPANPRCWILTEREAPTDSPKVDG